MNVEQITLIAEETRKKFRNKKVDKGELEELYSRYNSVGDTRLFVETAISHFPRLNCGLASVYLKKQIGKGNIINGKFKGNNHTFLLVDNRLVVDITSDQYGGPEVYVGQIKYPWRVL